MTLNNINTLRKDRGFTIVELLIVIVVIAILAAITIVAYNGIQNRGKASSSQSLASQVVKKASAFSTVDNSGNYPANVAAFANNNESKLDGVTAVDYVATTFNVAGTYTNGTTAVYRLLGATTGGCVYWWDYSAATPIQKPIYFGSVTTGC